MNNAFDIAIIMPALAAFSTVIIIITVIWSKTKQNLAVSKDSFREIVKELKDEHAILQSELANIKETLNSINDMMKEIN